MQKNIAPGFLPETLNTTNTKQGHKGLVGQITLAQPSLEPALAGKEQQQQ